MASSEDPIPVPRAWPARRTWMVRAAVAMLAAGGMAWSVCKAILAHRAARDPWDHWLLSAWCFSACGVVLYAVLTASWRRRRRDRLAAAAAAGTCSRCGYDLHHLRTNRCPECGTYFLMSWEVLGRRRGAAGSRDVERPV